MCKVKIENFHKERISLPNIKRINKNITMKFNQPKLKQNC